MIQMFEIVILIVIKVILVMLIVVNQSLVFVKKIRLLLVNLLITGIPLQKQHQHLLQLLSKRDNLTCNENYKLSNLWVSISFDYVSETDYDSFKREIQNRGKICKIY